MTERSDDDAEQPSGAPAKSDDIVFVHSPNERGDGVRVLRKRDDAIEVGEIREVKEGHPITGDVVRLKARAEHERLFDVETLWKKPASNALAAGDGPAQVATDRYRENWDAIFGHRDELN